MLERIVSLDPTRLYTIAAVAAFLEVEPERIKRAYLRTESRPNGLRYKKIGHQYLFDGRFLIEELLQFEK